LTRSDVPLRRALLDLSEPAGGNLVPLSRETQAKG
jgi:hypothetical protein